MSVHMSVHMLVCLYTCLYTCRCACTHVCTHAGVSAHMSVHMLVCLYAFQCTCLYTYRHVSMSVVHVCTYTGVHMSTVCVCTRIDAHVLRHMSVHASMCMSADMSMYMPAHTSHTLELVELKAGSTLFHAGDEGDALFILMSGELACITSACVRACFCACVGVWARLSMCVRACVCQCVSTLAFACIALHWPS